MEMNNFFEEISLEESAMEELGDLLFMKSVFSIAETAVNLGYIENKEELISALLSVDEFVEVLTVSASYKGSLAGWDFWRGIDGKIYALFTM